MCIIYAKLVLLYSFMNVLVKMFKVQKIDFQLIFQLSICKCLDDVFSPSIHRFSTPDCPLIISNALLTIFVWAWDQHWQFLQWVMILLLFIFLLQWLMVKVRFVQKTLQSLLADKYEQ